MLTDFIPVMVFGILCVLIFLLIEIFYRDRFIREGFYHQLADENQEIQSKKPINKLLLVLSIISILIALMISGYIVAISERAADPIPRTPSDSGSADSQVPAPVMPVPVMPVQVMPVQVMIDTDVLIGETEIVSNGFSQTEEAEWEDSQILWKNEP